MVKFLKFTSNKKILEFGGTTCFYFESKNYGLDWDFPSSPVNEF